MEEQNKMEKNEDVMLPGFRFHPTDEELVGFYLKRKVQQQSLPIELIKQVDIYKYDPWDLPKLSSTGEKEWYFYCRRDRKYKNSARPNRVTLAGFWKATGTDRPIYSSDHGTKCIGLKKSLVFYRGRAAKGFKTDWMMHEFRLPSTPSHNSPPKKLLDKTFPAYDSWAICRIFKKTNSMAQRGFSNSWASQCNSEFSPENNMCCTTELVSAVNQFCCDDNSTHDFEQQQSTMPNFSSYGKSPVFEIPDGFMFSPLEVSVAEKPCVDGGASMILSPSILGGFSSNNNNNNVSERVDFDGFSMGQRNMGTEEEEEEDLASLKKSWGPIRSLGFPFNLPANDNAWDFSLLPSPCDLSTNKCYDI